MKTIKTISWLLLSTFLWIAAPGQSLNDMPKKMTYAVEISGVLCGYSEMSITSTEKDGRKLLSVNTEAFVKQRALGGNVELIITENVLITPETELPVFVEQRFKTRAEIYSCATFNNGVAYYTAVVGGKPREIQLPNGVILENTLSYPHLMNDFIQGNAATKEYRVFDIQSGDIISKTYERIGEEKLELAGANYNTIVLEEFNHQTGTTAKFWLDKENSRALKTEGSNRLIYLADESIKKSIQVVDVDNLLFARVDKVIANVHAISSMRIEATIQSEGEVITAKNLNFPGQKFEGTVSNNLIEGVFEVDRQHYTGENAPPFPPKFADEKLKKYLEPERLIESDHPVLVQEAERITKDSKDAWEATVKLSTWVGENIMAAIPGGTSAINTYNTREGECGSHSRLLTAFCRAVGIPARLSIGCMYISYAGGCFYQHAWTEVYMGDAGWVAVDATAHEFDFVDAGHIRLGEKTSFNPKAMKILDYQMENAMVDNTVPDEYKKYLGNYLFEERNSIFKILYQDGSLAVDIPNAQVLALNPPDENGVFYPTVSRQLNFSFGKDIYGNISIMKLQQVIPLGKKFEQDSIASEVPNEIKPLVGNYWLAQAQADFKVIYENGVLAFVNPIANETVTLTTQTNTGLWKDEVGKNEVEFVRNDKNEVVRMLIYVSVYLKKQIEL
ncbi:transglutaminase-like domain-containing protein [Draconibacterium halophilum]|uniref:Transglutaminase domain-containing protein n=1 Tax=Draconibacterium halophilum TaxID=2706887 RepID=A0A6C0RAN2_9BACT|nr:transglutaminase-like domain-containing protein [Draconibacterium halophilum]QIA07066.1 transglutaminase domain-containing protein [Draconibacterium halophilum]